MSTPAKIVTALGVTLAAIIAIIAISAMAGGTTPAKPTALERHAKAMARVLSPENTARGIKASYRRDHSPLARAKVTCIDLTTDTQSCTVAMHGVVVGHLHVKLNTTTGAFEAAPID